jgi:NAD(P)-dependent dehydrogenase (short-subunit alcohol dehydrogenase family)
MSSFAVVLGASTGVGASIAKSLAIDGGLNIIGFHRGKHQAEANAVADRIREAGPRCDMFALDVGSCADAVNNGIAAVQNLLGAGAVKVLVHSVTGASMGGFLRQQPAKVEQTFNCLAHSFYYWCRGMHERKLFAQHARVVALSSPLVDCYFANNGVIAAAKAALENYVKQFAVTLGPHGHRVNCVRFDAVLTTALKLLLPPEKIAELDKLHARIVPAGRMQTARDVATFVTFLATRDTWANGSIIDYTGGLPLTLADVVFNG